MSEIKITKHAILKYPMTKIQINAKPSEFSPASSPLFWRGVRGEADK